MNHRSTKRKGFKAGKRYKIISYVSPKIYHILNERAAQKGWSLSGLTATYLTKAADQ